MAINRSSLFDRLDDSKETFTDVIYKRAGWYGSHAMSNDAERWNLYAVTDANKNAAEVAMPHGPFITLGWVTNKANAGRAAGKFKRWLEEYNNDRY